MFVERLEAQIEKDYKIFPQHVNRASSIGFPCIKNNIYQRTHWSQRKRPDTVLLFIFREGNNQEKAIKRALEEAGITVYQAERPIWLERYKLSGHIDGTVKDGDEDVLLEIKSAQDNLHDKINTVQDYLNSNKVWHKCYVVQIQIYIYAMGFKRGVFLTKAKSLGIFKEIPVDLDMDIVNSTLDKCLVINQCCDSISEMLDEVYDIGNIADLDNQRDRKDYEEIKQEAFLNIEKMLPERINDLTICDQCDFSHICLPDQIRESQIKLYTEAEDFIKKLVRRDELHPLQKEFNALDKSVKLFLKQRPEERFFISDENVKGVMFEIINGKQMKITLADE